MTQTKFTLPLLIGVSAGLVACASPKVPVEYINEARLDRYTLEVAEQTETLEIFLNQDANELSLVDHRRLRAFLRAYKDHGHGPLNMVLPESTPNQQFAVGAVAQAREAAFESGVDYQMIEGGAKYDEYASMVLSFKSYKTIKPECQSLAEIDFADSSANNELSSFGCSVRTNMAAMIADPSDILGNRPLDPADSVRRQTTFEAYRAGEATASERNQGESGTVSEAVQDQ